ncbi:Hypothetical predicted protein [Octopus vulgaris]|uniref:Uncharacterized protein n=1 Tax=Octopus vulgaris TaxID=6645 RepID=A0AA36FH96_OCTVU|nr:Hypothetical predicted protein [Octopus vulgaris]
MERTGMPSPTPTLQPRTGPPLRVKTCSGARRRDAERTATRPRGSEATHTARPTRSSEPILLPKVRIHFADFPYLHWRYRREAVHLGDLLRMVGTDRLESCDSLRTRIFQGRRERTGRRPRRGALQVPYPYLRTSRFHGRGPLRRRENSSRGSRQRLRARLRCRCFARPPASTTDALLGRARRVPADGRALSEFGFGNINPIPFRCEAGRVL